MASTAAPKAALGFAIVFVSVSLWATAAVPAYMAALTFFALALALGVAPPAAVLSGFWSSAAGLVFGGLIIGAAAERSGLGRYVARGLLQRFLRSYPRFILGILVGTGALSFLVPSTMGRLAITIPIITAATKEAGYEPGSNGYVGAMVTTVAGNFLISYAILPANLLNIIAVGAVEGLYGPQVQYAEYLLLCAPVLGLVKGLIFWACIVVFLPAPPPAVAPDATQPLALSGATRRLSIVLGFAILLWATDFLHGVKPAVVTLAAAALCLLPPVALVSLKESFDLNRMTAILSTAAVLGVATVLAHSGAGTLTAETVTSWASLENRSPALGFAATTLLTAAIAVPTTGVGCIAIMNPIIGSIAASTGLSIKMGLIAEMTGLQIPLFPYQNVPIMVGLAMGGVAATASLRILLPLAIAGILVLLPLQILWLKLIGQLP